MLRSSSCHHSSAKVRSLHGFSHFVVFYFYVIVVWCFFRLRIKPKSHLVIRVPTGRNFASRLLRAVCVVMNLSPPPSSINEDVSPESHVSKSFAVALDESFASILDVLGLGLGLGLGL